MEITYRGYTRHIVTITLSLISLSLFGQDQIIAIDKKVIEIENYKKFTMVKWNDNEMKGLNHNLIEVVDYRGEKKAFSKCEEKLKMDSGLSSRTYYFDSGKLICIKEKKNIVNGTPYFLTYYFSNNTLIKVVSDNRVDMTSEINKSELQDRIMQYWAIRIS